MVQMAFMLFEFPLEALILLFGTVKTVPPAAAKCRVARTRRLNMAGCGAGALQRWGILCASASGGASVGGS